MRKGTFSLSLSSKSILPFFFKKKNEEIEKRYFVSIGGFIQHSSCSVGCRHCKKGKKKYLKKNKKGEKYLLRLRGTRW